ncbi:hypothetical protein GCM10020358_43440 [Amorphoplanes nipponensis]
MVGHDIDEHPQPELVGPGQQDVEGGQVAEEGVDVGVVADVVAVVGLRGPLERRQPDRRGAEAGDVVQAGGEAGQVADAVAVRVGEGARVDLIDGVAHVHNVSPSRR